MTETPLTFGPFRLDPVSGRLLRGETPVPLSPKAFSLLHFLARHGGRLIGKAELLEAIWPGVFVSDAVLKVTIRDVRKALGDNPHAPEYIETAHRRGYRFIAHVETLASRRHAPPRVQYARSGSVSLAFQVIGSGAIDVVFVMGWVSHLESFWEEPSFARFLTRLGAMARVILFDKRGTGLSDPVPVSELPTLDERLDDVRAVMDAAGSERAILLGVSEGGPLCTMFAATYPEKTAGLVMIGSYARRLADVDYPWGRTPAERDAFCREILDAWGGPVGLEDRAPSRAGDPAFREWWASYLRRGASPGAAVALTRMNAEIDVRDVLPTIQVPTLVLHRSGDRCLRVEEGRYLASRIPSATFVELPGDDHLPFVGDQDAMLGEIERFLARAPRPAPAERVLATVLTVRWDAGADDERARTIVDREVRAHRGRGLDPGAGRVSASFDGPGRAVRCGRAACATLAAAGVRARAGVHIGECDPAATAPPLAATAAEIAATAGPGEVVVSRTVVDLVAGSGLAFTERGTIPLAGARRDLPLLAVAGDWQPATGGERPARS